jgi:hypothetical protein
VSNGCTVSLFPGKNSCTGKKFAVLLLKTYRGMNNIKLRSKNKTTDIMF